MKNRPKVGVGVIIRKDNQVLLGKRMNAHGENTWNFPGGHLEFNETPENCAIREVKEETNLDIKNPKKGPWTNDVFKDDDKHYITIFMIADYSAGIPQVMEPEKCTTWEWFSWDNLPKSLFLPIKNLHKINYNPFES